VYGPFAHFHVLNRGGPCPDAASRFRSARAPNFVLNIRPSEIRAQGMPRARCARRWGNGRRGLPSKPRYWAMCDHLRADLPLAALAMAIAARRPSRPDPPICLGRVSQTDATRRLAVAKLTAIDNAPMESFFHILKTEFVHHRRYATRAEATRDIFAHIEGFYNRNASPLRHRLHQPARDRAKGSLTLSIFRGKLS
jgi:hypothetical protein